MTRVCLITRVISVCTSLEADRSNDFRCVVTFFRSPFTDKKNGSLTRKDTVLLNRENDGKMKVNDLRIFCAHVK